MNKAVDNRAAEILLVEDNPGDVVLLRKAMESVGWSHHLNVVQDGREAMDFLLRRDVFAHAPKPDLILLDHNLPGKNGRELLAEIKEDAELSRIPFIFLSGSKWERDIVVAVGIPADGYIVKPHGYLGYLETVRQIEAIWRKSRETESPGGL